MNQKTAFVTGAAGFLGRHLVSTLAQAGWRIHALVRGAAPGWLAAQAGVTVHRGAAEDRAALRAAMPQGVDAVFHLAGNTSSWRGDAVAIQRDNVLATQALLDVARERGAARVVMTSTLGVFRLGGRIEERSAMLAPGERNPYLRSKLLADAMLSDAGQRGLPVVSLHPAHMLGAHDVSGWVRLFDDAAAGRMAAAPGGRASFCAAREVARAHLGAALLAAPARRYVLGGADASYLELFRRIAHLTGAKPVTRTVPKALLYTVACAAQGASWLHGRRPAVTPGLARILAGELVCDSALAEADLGYRAVPLPDMLQESFADWSARPSPGAIQGL
ncbi:MAG: NAD-dependent epimerase/dehydratase family protein [Comamonadaceae bacterium]|nr:NAD-dependent epimerase/dehydratase family protein [Comamonadaceae bacterium]